MKRRAQLKNHTRAAVAGLLVAGLLACSDSTPTTATKPAPAPSSPGAPAAKAPAPASPATVADAARGAVLYATYCATCHGPAGAGDGVLAASLDPKPARHNDAAYMDTLSDEQLFEVTKKGGPAVGKSALMAPWGGTLSDAQIHDLVAFMRTLSAH